MQKVNVVAVPDTGAVTITCQFAHTAEQVGCVVILTVGTFRKGGSASTSTGAVMFPQATVEFTDLRPREYTYTVIAFLVTTGELLQENQSISGTIALVGPVPHTPEETFIYESEQHMKHVNYYRK